MSKYCLGIDVGGTSVKLGLFDTEGNVLDKWEIPTRKEEGGKHILPDVAASVLDKIAEKKIDKAEIAGAGIGIPGPVDGNGVVKVCVNVGWENVDARSDLSELLGMPVKVGNDANVAALGEMWKGGGAGYNSIVMVTLGTGVGGGIIVDGKIVNGSTGAGGEIGHIHIQDGEEDTCGCGNRGCLEQYASATGIVRLANRKLKASEKASVLRGGEVSAKTVFDAVKAGDELAIEVAEEFGNYLGRGLAAIAGVVNPEAFVIGGGVSKAGTVVLDYIKKYYIPYAFSGCREAKFTLATLGNDAGIYGSAKMILE